MTSDLNKLQIDPNKSDALPVANSKMLKHACAMSFIAVCENDHAEDVLPLLALLLLFVFCSDSLQHFTQFAVVLDELAVVLQIVYEMVVLDHSVQLRQLLVSNLDEPCGFRWEREVVCQSVSVFFFRECKMLIPFRVVPYLK